jgi:hypothetical protein
LLQPKKRSEQGLTAKINPVFCKSKGDTGVFEIIFKGRKPGWVFGFDAFKWVRNVAEASS